MKSLGEWLKEHDIPALCNVDCRMLAKTIRVHGSMLGKIELGELALGFEDPNKRNLVAEVSLKIPRIFNEGGTVFAPPNGQRLLRIIVLDCGIKYNMIRSVAQRGVELLVVPYDYELSKTNYEYDGILISNGPGDPMQASKTVESIKWAITQKQTKVGARTKTQNSPTSLSDLLSQHSGLTHALDI